MLLHGINYNILIHHLSYSVLYEDKKNEISKKIYILGLEPSTQKTAKMVVHISLSTLGI